MFKDGKNHLKNKNEVKNFWLANVISFQMIGYGLILLNLNGLNLSNRFQPKRQRL